MDMTKENDEVGANETQAYKVVLEWDSDWERWYYDVVSPGLNINGCIYPGGLRENEKETLSVFDGCHGNIYELAEAFALLAQKYSVAELSRLGQEQGDIGIEPAKERYRKNSHWHDVYVGPCECGAWHRAGDMDDVRAEQGE